MNKNKQSVNKKILHGLFCFFITVIMATPLVFNHAFVNEYTRPKQYYFFFVMTISALLLFFGFLFRKKQLFMYIHLPDLFIAGYYVYCVLLIILNNGLIAYNIALLKLTGIIIFYFIAKNFIISFRTQRDISQIGFFVIILMIPGIIEGFTGIIQFIQHKDALLVHGTFDNTGPFANYMGMLFPVALGYLMLVEKKKRIITVLCYTFILTGLIIIPVSRARTAWIAVFASSLMILWFHYQKQLKVLFNTRIKKLIIVLVTLLCIGTSSYLLFNMKKDSALGRLFVWKITTQMIADKPLTGHGFDAYYPVKNKYQANYFAGGAGTEKEKMVAGNIRFAFNDYLQITASTGIIGLVLFLLFIGTSIFPFSNDKNNPYLLIFNTGIVALLLMSLFSYPLQRLSTQLNFFFFIAIINAFGHKPVKTIDVNNTVKIAFSLVIIILLMLLIKMQWEKYQANLKWKELAIKAQSGQRKSVFDDYKRLLPVLSHNPFFLFNYGAELSVAGHYKEGLNILNKAKPLIYDSDVFVYLGNCYLGLQKYKQAEDAYMEAIHLKPYLFIPRYQLVHLYVHRGNNKKAVQMAKEIIALKPKVNTNMIRNIKHEMYAFLQNFKKN